MKDTWAVLGASGFIGQSLVKKLESENYAVRALHAPRLTLAHDERSPSRMLKLEDYNVLQRELTNQLKGTEIVVLAAGLAKPDSKASSELYGANALLPVIAAKAAEDAGCKKFIHLSSAAVQGNKKILTAERQTSPFSPYSDSKALGEAGLLLWKDNQSPRIEVMIVRATSVQGPGRGTSAMLTKIANSPLSSVAGSRTRPTVVSSLNGLTEFILAVAISDEIIADEIFLQPWEGHTVGSVLESFGDHRPVILPTWLCAIVVWLLATIGRGSSKIRGISRRIELMWFGQQQESRFYWQNGELRRKS